MKIKPKVWIWTAVLAFLGYSLGGKGAIEHPTKELLGAVAGGALGFSIGWGIQRYDERRKRHPL
jgi:membrane protein DedA with SNARE-associated domain